MMKLQTSQRKYAKMKMALQGPSGSGKTYSSLLLAFGLCNDWNKVAVIDTEHESAHLYADLGPYQVLSIYPPFTPDNYISAINFCEKAGMEVIILDSTTHLWEYLLDYHSSLLGNSFTNWSKVNPMYNSFVQKLLQSPTHIIATIRKKQDYILNQVNGKMVPEKIGLKTIQRDSFDYEFTIVLDLDTKNFASASKDRTGLFFDKAQQVIGIATGQQIADWCNSGTPVTIEDVSVKIAGARSIQNLLAIYQQYPQFKKVLQNEYEGKKRDIMLQQPVQPEFNNHQILSSNGTH